MIQEFSCSFEELGIESGDLAGLMGFEGKKIPEPFPGYIKIALRKAKTSISVRAGYKVYDSAVVDKINHTLTINQHQFSPSKIVIARFAQATQFALFVCTAGHKITELAQQTSAEDPLLAYVYDVLGSVTVDKATDRLELHLEKHIMKSGMRISDRFSPGYCDWNVSEQQQLFDLLPEGFCGITLTESSLMKPIKSVSGIIGIGKNVNKKGYQCNWCDDKNCIYGRIRRKKGR